MNTTPQRISILIKQAARDVGFDRCGIAPAGPIPRGSYLADWLAKGYAGTMGYLHRHSESRTDVRTWLPWARSVIVVALSYHQADPKATRDSATRSPHHNVNPPSSNNPTGSGSSQTRKTPRSHNTDMGTCQQKGKNESESSIHGRVAMYAWGEDYHVVIREKLAMLVSKMREQIDRPFQERICVDTSAIIERELAAAAGIGWIGKNTLVLNTSLGSFFFLGEIITDLPLAADVPETDHCGTCTRCLDACPTGAFPAPYTMDAGRCISYLTIEHRGEIDGTLAEMMDDWVFGCDECQTACPYNNHAKFTAERRLIGGAEAPTSNLDEILAWDPPSYRAAVQNRATSRAKLSMWRRNAEIARCNVRRQS